MRNGSGMNNEILQHGTCPTKRTAVTAVHSQCTAMNLRFFLFLQILCVCVMSVFM